METQQLRVIRNSRRRRRQRIRRFLVVGIIITAFTYMTYSIYATQRTRLDEARTELAYYQQTLDEVMLRQGFYQNQVVRLEDEDYIAMLARERYFRSLPNEVIFRLIDGGAESSILNVEHQNEEY